MGDASLETPYFKGNLPNIAKNQRCVDKIRILEILHQKARVSHATVGNRCIFLRLCSRSNLPLRRCPSADEQVELFEPLTSRELEVLQLLGQRLTNKEIGLRLNISPLTVKRHTVNIYKKLDVGGRRRAVIKARAIDLLPPE